MDQVKNLESFIPSSYHAGEWFQAKLLNGRDCEVRRSKAAGYIKIRIKCIIPLKSPDGTIISRHNGFMHFTLNTRTGEIKQNESTIGSVVNE